MVNTLRNIRRLSIFLILPLMVVACVKEEVITFDPESEAWLSKIDEGEGFMLVDGNGISQEVYMSTSDHYFLEGSGGFLFMTTHKHSREYRYQSFQSTYGLNFSVSLTAESAPFGDELFLTVWDTEFAVELKNMQTIRVGLGGNLLSLGLDDKEYINNGTISSTSSLLDSYTVNGVEYQEVLHFMLKDFETHWVDYTITEVYYAKGYGFIHLVCKNGLTFSRI